MADEATLNSIKEMFGYTDAQLEKLMSNPRNLGLVEHAADFLKYRLVAEVVSAYGCGAGHKVGDKIIYKNGALLCNESSKQICFGLLSAISPCVHVVMEKVFSGEDPTKIAFNRHHCPDVGVDHGGFGEVIVEVKVEKV